MFLVFYTVLPYFDIRSAQKMQKVCIMFTRASKNVQWGPKFAHPCPIAIYIESFPYSRTNWDYNLRVVRLWQSAPSSEWAVVSVLKINNCITNFIISTNQVPIKHFHKEIFVHGQKSIHFKHPEQRRSFSNAFTIYRCSECSVETHNKRISTAKYYSAKSYWKTYFWRFHTFFAIVLSICFLG